MICQARQAAAHGSGFLPGGHGNPDGHVTIGQSHMLSDSRLLINSYTKINLLLLAAATPRGLHFSQHRQHLSRHTDTAG